MFRYNYICYSSFNDCIVKKHTPTMQGLATRLVAEDVSFEDKIFNYIAYEHRFDDIIISLKRSAAKNLLDLIYLRSNEYINTNTKLVSESLHYISKANCNMYMQSRKNKNRRIISTKGI